jgi:thiol-disulfide isomerase/thioredoxin
MNNILRWVGVWAAVAALSPIRAVEAAQEPPVGSQAPEVRARAWLNAQGPTTLAGLRGKVVVVEFWATWCGPCLQSMPHIDALAKKWADKGLTVLSLTREDRRTVEQFFRSQKFEPSYTIGCGSNSLSAYGVRGIPRAFVIDPTGAVAWVGHPMSGLDEVLAKMLASADPPTTAPATDPNDAEMSTAAEALGQGEYAKSLAILEDVLKSSEDEARARQASELMAEVLEVGDGKLNEAQSLLKEKKYVEAAELLRRLAEQFADTEVGRKARARLMALRRQPAASLALQQDQWRQEADAMLARADVLLEQKRYAQAVERYKLVTMLYSRTDAGTKARLKVRQLEGDEQIAAQIREQKATRQAVGWLSIARSYARIGRDARARATYRKLIRAYPDTSYAEAAKQEMESLPRRSAPVKSQ